MTSDDRLRQLAHSKVGNLVQSIPLISTAAESLYSAILDKKRKQFIEISDDGYICVQSPTVGEMKYVGFDVSYTEIRVIEKILERIKEDEVILDIGANVGHHTIPYGKYAKVIPFEPIDTNVEVLRQNINLNNGVDADIYEVALSDESDISTFQVQKELHEKGMADPRAGFKKEGTTTEVSVKTEKLDNINIQHVDCMKVDVEGSELKMLRGAQKTLEEFHPDIFLEIHPEKMSQYNHSPEDVFQLLDGYGYTSEVLVPDEKRKYIHFK